MVVLDDENHRQFPQGGHVERLVDLTLVRGTIAEIGKGNVVVALILVRKGDARAKGHVRAHDTVAAIEFLFLREHMHGPALAAGIAAFAAGEFGHHPVGVHAAGKHMPVVAVGGDAAVAVLGRGFKPDNHRFLSDIKVTETADHTHAV